MEDIEDKSTNVNKAANHFFIVIPLSNLSTLLLSRFYFGIFIT
jgi:hypothetical protein